jgi:ligand-binding sensor domain-containing protein
MSFAGYGQWTQTGGPKGTITRTLSVNGTAVLAGTDDGMFLSSDNGTVWTAINTGIAHDTVLACTVKEGSIFAGTSHSGVFRSTNNGASWTATNNGFPRDSLDTNSFSSVNSFASIGGAMIAGTFQKGISLSRNNGASWSPMNSGLTNMNIYALVASGNDFFSGTGAGGGVFLYSNAESTWTVGSNGLAYIKGMTYSVLTLAAGKNSLFAGTFCGGLYSSANNGESWRAVNTGLSANIVLSLFAYGDTMYAGTDFNGVFFSTDNGDSWTAFNSGLPDNNAVLCFCVSNGALFCGIYGSGVWRRPLLNAPGIPNNVVLEKSAAAGTVFRISGSSGILRYTMPVAGHVSIKYYDLTGRLLASLVNHNQAAGNYSLVMPSLPKGLYIRDFKAGNFIQRDRVN